MCLQTILMNKGTGQKGRVTMKRKLISLAAIISLVFSIYTVSMADEAAETDNSTAAGLKSTGAIVYKKGLDSVVVDSEDLYMLADKVDSFKTSVAEQLAAMHTYLTQEEGGMALTTDGNIKIMHSEPAGQADPRLLGFDTILEGIAASQSIPQESWEYGYAEGTLLYKTGDGKLTLDTAAQGIEEIGIAATAADNMSAGKAAWVDGKLLLGTGADNQAYYQLGYTEGCAAKQPANGTIKYHYHVHKDGAGNTVTASQVNGANPGGCYRAAGHTHTGSCPQGTCRVDTECYSSSKGESGLYHNQYHHHHRNCGLGTVDGSSWSKTKGEDYTDTHQYYTCGNQPANIWTIQCGKTPSTIEWAEIIYK